MASTIRATPFLPSRGSYPIRTVRDRSGAVIGRAVDFYFSANGGWLGVAVGRLRRRLVLAPLDGCRVEAPDLFVPWGASTVKTAPRVRRPKGQTIDELLDSRLCLHYRL